MNPFEFVLAIIVVVSVVRVIRYRMGDSSAFERPFKGFRHQHDIDPPASRDNADTRLLRDEVRQLKERIQVLERITVEKENSLAREIDDLRQR